MLFSACKKDENTQRFEGRVRRGNNGNGLSGVTVKAQTQELNNGVFNSEFSTIANTTTDGTGQYDLPFEVATYSSLRLQFSKSFYHTLLVDVDPDHFESNNSFTKNVHLYPQATISLHISDGAQDFEQFNFRYKNTDFECVCCDDSWKVIDQPNIDTTFSCMVYGDQTVYYEYRMINNELDTLIQGSIFCPAFATQNLDLTY
jgi:hypothetical protein